MHYAQIFRYGLDLDASDYRSRFVDPYAETIAGMKGLVGKTWMADFDTNEYASFYLWDSKEAMEAFMASPEIATVAAETFLRDLVVTTLPVVEDASALTRGL